MATYKNVSDLPQTIVLSTGPLTIEPGKSFESSDEIHNPNFEMSGAKSSRMVGVEAKAKLPKAKE